MDESFNRYKQEREKGNRLIEESEKKYFRNINIKNQELEKLDEKINQQLKNNKFSIDAGDNNKPEKETKKDSENFLRTNLKNIKLPGDKTDSRYNNYKYVYDAIADANLENDEKQALFEAVYLIQQQFTKTPEESS
ncbi:MAG: hypothetical protein FWC19_07675 [Treponema sp.]|nr:hypothetical protein [Treponema sp.]MCL2272660.1 hypothetical protein [Treponema sp.]